MKKADMIKVLQDTEGYLWLQMREYECRNAPDDGDDGKRVAWEANDPEYKRRLDQWYHASVLLEKLEVETDYTGEWYKIAGNLSTDLFLRRQAAKGITY